MLRAAAGRLGSVVSNVLRTNVSRTCAVVSTRQASGATETADEFDERYIEYFSRSDITDWEARKAINDLASEDVVPDSRVIVAGLEACRRLNDHSMAVRFLEGVKFKCGPLAPKIWPYLLKELEPTLKRLGVSTPEDLGYDQPELASVDVYDIH